MTRKKKQNKAKIGLGGYVRILALLRDEPMTIRELWESRIVGRVAAYRILGTLHAVGRLSIVGWRNRFRGAPAPVYGWPQGFDVPRPTRLASGRAVRGMRPIAKPKLSTEVMVLTSLMRLLEDPLSRTELIEATGVCHHTLRGALKALRKYRIVRVAFWIPRINGGTPTQYFQLGRGRDAERPKKQTTAELNKRQWERRKAKQVIAPLVAAMVPIDRMAA